jgi:hypothetical protein
LVFLVNKKTTFHTIPETAWILGTSRAAVSRSIRTGEIRASRRRSGLLVSSIELARLLGAPTSNGGAA